MLEAETGKIQNTDEWLTTRNKRKITPEKKIKKTHSRAFRQKKSTLDIQLTQNSPPPPQLFLETKQSDIMSFFNRKNKGNKRKEACKIINCDSEGSKDKVCSDDTYDYTLVLEDVENNDITNTSKDEEECDMPDGHQKDLDESRNISLDFPDIISIDSEREHCNFKENRNNASNLALRLKVGDETGSSRSLQIFSLRELDYTTDMCLHNASKGIKRKKLEESSYGDRDFTRKRPLIDSQTAALELENFSCTENVDSLNGKSQRPFKSDKIHMIDSEEAAWELQNFSVDTENLSQYIYK